MPSSLRRSLRFLTVRTRSANMEQSRTSKLHTTLSMPIDSSLIYARYILKRKITHVATYVLSIKISQDPYISTKNSRLIDSQRNIYLDIFIFYISFNIKGIHIKFIQNSLAIIQLSFYSS